jgi:hypothetical protein
LREIYLLAEGLFASQDVSCCRILIVWLFGWLVQFRPFVVLIGWLLFSGGCFGRFFVRSLVVFVDWLVGWLLFSLAAWLVF